MPQSILAKIHVLFFSRTLLIWLKCQASFVAVCPVCFTWAADSLSSIKMWVGFWHLFIWLSVLPVLDSPSHWALLNSNPHFAFVTEKNGGFFPFRECQWEFWKMLVFDYWKKDWLAWKRKELFTAGFISGNLLCVIVVMSKWHPPFSFSKLFHHGNKS